MRPLRLLCVCLLFWVALSTAAFAEGRHDRTQFGHDINIGPGEEVVAAIRPPRWAATSPILGAPAGCS